LGYSGASPHQRWRGSLKIDRGWRPLRPRKRGSAPRIARLSLHVAQERPIPMTVLERSVPFAGDVENRQHQQAGRVDKDQGMTIGRGCVTQNKFSLPKPRDGLMK